MLRQGTLLLLLAGCTTTEQLGAPTKSVPFTDRCEEETARARVERGPHDTLEFTVHSTATCRDGEIRTYKTERNFHSWVLPTLLGVVVGAVIEIPILVGLAFVAGKATNNSSLGDGFWVVLLPGILVGSAVAVAVGKTTIKLPDGDDQQVEEVRSSRSSMKLSSGTLVVEADPNLKWELAGGKASVPIDVLWQHDLGRLLVNGILLHYDDDSRPLLGQLSACRRALQNWHLGAEGTCDQEQERYRWARTCRLAGFDYASAVEARLQQLGCGVTP